MKTVKENVRAVDDKSPTALMRRNQAGQTNSDTKSLKLNPIPQAQDVSPVKDSSKISKTVALTQANPKDSSGNWLDLPPVESDILAISDNKEDNEHTTSDGETPSAPEDISKALIIAVDNEAEEKPLDAVMLNDNIARDFEGSTAPIDRDIFLTDDSIETYEEINSAKAQQNTGRGKLIKTKMYTKALTLKQFGNEKIQ
eukprot:14262750-Ditylum_brightwellii.AAC.1